MVGLRTSHSRLFAFVNLLLTTLYADCLAAGGATTWG
jgi:hypothetical protein